jgi:hypothetical protein
MKQGVAILGRTLGERNLRYLSVEVTYARLLNKEGFHEEAARVKGATEPVLQEVYGEQCVGCTVSVAALR